MMGVVSRMSLESCLRQMSALGQEVTVFNELLAAKLWSRSTGYQPRTCMCVGLIEKGVWPNCYFSAQLGRSVFFEFSLYVYVCLINRKGCMA